MHASLVSLSALCEEQFTSQWTYFELQILNQHNDRAHANDKDNQHLTLQRDDGMYNDKLS